jgi:hypothetical protein
MNTDNFKNDKEFDLYIKGAWEERERIIALLNNYLSLTVFSEEAEQAEPNPKWTAGFNSAIALIKGESK